MQRKSSEREHHVGASWRAIFLGFVLITPNAYWIMDSAGQGYPTTVSLYFNVIFCVFIITALNYLWAQVNPRLALKQGERIQIFEGA